jgi:hypothetical protein
MLRAVDPAVAYVVVYLRAAGDGWPADVGDDPAFECSRQRAHAGAQLSWGVCRPDLRNTITTGDVVVFIAADRLSDRPSARYKLAGWATAERAVSQLDVWQHEELAVYRHYRNLLTGQLMTEAASFIMRRSIQSTRTGCGGWPATPAAAPRKPNG